MSNLFSQHPTSAYLLALSALFERFAYYGTRSLLLLYLMEKMDLGIEKAIALYGFVTVGSYIAKGLGGLIGDYLIGNKITALIGAGAQLIAILLLASGSENMLYPVLALFAIGGGLYNVNMIGLFGQLYLNKRRITDAGFAMVYVMINVGAFLSTSGLIFSSSEWSPDPFYFLAVAICCAGTLLFFSQSFNHEQPMFRPKFALSSSAIMICVTGAAVLLFWGVYEFAGSGIYMYSAQFTQLDEISNTYYDQQFINSAVIVIFSCVVFFIWTLHFMSQFLKLFIGLTLGAVAFLLLSFLPDIVSTADVTIYGSGLLLLGVAEGFISIPALTIYTLVAHPKYIASVYGIVSLVIALVSRQLTKMTSYYDEDPNLTRTFIISFVILGLAALGMFLFKHFYKPKVIRYSGSEVPADSRFSEDEDILD